MSEQQAPQAPADNAVQGQPTQAASTPQHAAAQTAKKKKKGMNPALKVILWIVVIIVIIILGLVISAYIAGFESVFDMIDWIRAEIGV